MDTNHSQNPQRLFFYHMINLHIQLNRFSQHKIGNIHAKKNQPVEKRLRDYYGLIRVPVFQDGPVQRSSFGLDERQNHLLLGDLCVDKAPQRRHFTGEELHSTSRNLVPVTPARVYEVSGTTHHITHAGLFDVLHRTERVRLERTGSGTRFWTTA